MLHALALILTLGGPAQSGPRPELTEFGSELGEQKKCGAPPEFVGTFQLVKFEGHEDQSAMWVYIKRHTKDLFEIVILEREVCNGPLIMRFHDFQERPKKYKCEATDGTSCL